MEKKKFRLPTPEELEEWDKNLSEEERQLLDQGDPVIRSLIKLGFDSSWSKVDDHIRKEVIKIVFDEKVQLVDAPLLMTRFSKCYLFTEFDSIMEEVGLKLDGELANKEVWSNIFSALETLLQFQGQIGDIRSATLNAGEQKRLNLPVDPALKKFLEERQLEAKSYEKLVKGLDKIGREKDIPTLQVPIETLLGRSKNKIRHHFLKGVYKDIELITEGKKGSKLEKQLLLKPLIEIIAPDYPFPTEEEWAAQTDRNDSETTMSYRDKIGKMVSKFVGE